MTIGVQRMGLRRSTVRVEIARFLPSALLAAYGVFILSLFARGVLTWYINPSYVLPTTAAGVVLIGLAALRLLRPPVTGCECAECAEEACDCEGASPRIWPYAVMRIPLLIALLFPPRSLAAFSARQRGLQIAGVSTVSNTTAIRRVSLSVDTRSFTMEDWVGALSADPNPRDYLGKPVSVTGMVLHSPASVPPGSIMVIRYLVTCCIADARPVGLIVKDPSHGRLQDNQWVTVNGTMGAAEQDGEKVAVVVPKTWKTVKSGNPYIY
jgi:uncharacterized repeat protein (TIGR03943 family)